MLPLNDRLNAMVQILKESDERLKDDARFLGTGYLAFKPESLMQAVENLHMIKKTGSSIDLGCGIGSWMLLSAAAGYDSYGIEIHPLLIEETMRNYHLAIEKGIIDPKTVFKLASGNFYLASEKEAMLEFRKLHDENPQSMPWIDADAYSELGRDLADFDIIYAWSWPIQSRFLYNFLERTARKDAIFVLPAYIRYTQGEHMNEYLKEPNKLILEKINPSGEIYIGRRVV